MKSLIKQLKENDQDHEYYPTTPEIIGFIYQDMINEQCFGERSILDIGAGNGNFFKVLESLQPPAKDEYDRNRFFLKKYAIEKSPILIENMPPDIFVIGTDFQQQTLIDKEVDIIFCNPPYSEYESWMRKIISESNSKSIYMVIPERWKNSGEILSLIEKRGMEYTIIGNTDFLDSEYRQARAKVDVIRINGKDHYYSGRSYRSNQTDPFNLWFDSFFKINAEQEKEYSYKAETEKKEEIRSNLVKGQNLIERLEELYREDFEKLLRNYRILETLDKELFKELEINLDGLKAGLKMKIKGLKNLYWQELFNNLKTIADRLTHESRKKLLDKLLQHTSIDFTSANAYAVVIWAIKNANIYMDDQLKQVYLWMTRPENVVNYKSNERMISDDWRYSREHTHYSLDYRLVLHGYNNFSSNTFGRYDYPNGLNKQTHERINDLITIAANLGFTIDQNSFAFEWSPRKEIKFTSGGKLFMSIRAYKNGNIHIKADQKFMKKLNIEAARLNGWVKSPEDASSEMDIPLHEVKELYGGNFQITGKGVLLIA